MTIIEFVGKFFFELRLSSARGHRNKIFKRHCSSTLRSAFLTERVLNVWNSLSDGSVDFSSLKYFQHSIRAVDLSGFCIGSVAIVRAQF